MLHCDLRVRWKVASDLRFRAAICEPKTFSFCRISGDLAPSTEKSLEIAIVRFWCAKNRSERKVGADFWVQRDATKHSSVTKKLTYSHASFFPFCPLCWPPVFSGPLHKDWEGNSFPKSACEGPFSAIVGVPENSPLIGQCQTPP